MLTQYCVFSINLKKKPAAVAQWPMRSAAEPENVGSIPGSGSRVFDGGEK